MRDAKMYIVISAEKSNLPVLENIQRDAELEGHLHALEFKYQRAIGRYRGVQESSYIVTAFNQAQVYQLLRLAKEYNQESILEINQSHGWLVYTDGGEEYLGSVFQATGREESYTQVGSKLFTVKKGA